MPYAFNINHMSREKECYKTVVIIYAPKHTLWVLPEIASLRQFHGVPTRFIHFGVKIRKKKKSPQIIAMPVALPGAI